MSNLKFQNALNRKSQDTPPIWLMRQAGRYHKHYQNLRAKYSFMELCKNPDLAAQVTMGPIDDFDFDVAILFSDLLFPLETLGMGLEYSDKGPQLGWHLDSNTIKNLGDQDSALKGLEFQKVAMKLTREILPSSKSLIGFVGGPWTLFSYAVQGKHEGGLAESKKAVPLLFNAFCDKIVPLLISNIKLQLEGGAEIVMIFDTAAGELTSADYLRISGPVLKRLADAHPGKLGFYSKGTERAHIKTILSYPWAGAGVDQRWDFTKDFSFFKNGFIQGNFDQTILKSTPPAEFRARLLEYLSPFRKLSPEMRAGWVCGLGHGVLPQTPEDNVRAFVQIVREFFSKEASFEA